MASFPYLLFIIKSLVIILNLLELSHSKACPKTKTCSKFGLAVRFPFRIPNPNDADDPDQTRCGYPGFDLSCNDMWPDEPIVSLPSGDFAVTSIVYASQTMTLVDPSKCLPRRFLERNFSLAGTPFRVIETLGSFTFLNCSTGSGTGFGEVFEAVPCLSGEGYTVVALPSMLFRSAPLVCRVLAVVSVLVVSSNTRWVDHSWEFFLRSSVRLAWDEPRCGECERRGGECWLIGGVGSEIGCYGLGKTGLSTRTQIAVYAILAIAITAFFVSNCPFKCSLNRPSNITRVYSRNRNPSDLSELTDDDSESSQGRQANNNNAVIVASLGLDETVIESYPKSVVGESRRLIGSNYNACPICLSEYRSNDTLRTLPDCFHYFHSDCIDEWLRLNATCPLCRHSPLVAPYGRAAIYS